MPPWAYFVLDSSLVPLVIILTFLSGNFWAALMAKDKPAIPEPMTKKSLLIFVFDN
jgi:hypothetical protein